MIIINFAKKLSFAVFLSALQYIGQRCVCV